MEKVKTPRFPCSGRWSILWKLLDVFPWIKMTIRLPKSYQVGTKVTLIGHEEDKEITVQEWADYVGTINYEIVCFY